MRGFLDGDYSLEEAKELMKRNTRRLAKRQLTWFRKEKRIQWLETDNTSLDHIAERISHAVYEKNLK